MSKCTELRICDIIKNKEDYDKYISSIPDYAMDIMIRNQEGCGYYPRLFLDEEKGKMECMLYFRTIDNVNFTLTGYVYDIINKTLKRYSNKDDDSFDMIRENVEYEYVKQLYNSNPFLKAWLMK